MRSAARLILLSLIWGYRLLLSGLLGGQCRFEPSCSYYAEQALNKYGPWLGLKLTLKRLSCCHPWHKGGFDPVD